MSDWRFKLADVEDNNPFPQLTFEINPEEYSIEEDKPFQEVKASDGSRIVIKFPFAKEKRIMRWPRISRSFYLELRDRYYSGHRFALQDHNGEVLIGRITSFEFSEIVATVPSEYEGSIIFTGVGKLE